MASPSPIRRSSRHQNVLAKHEENDASKSNVCSKEANIGSISLVKSKNASPMVNGGTLNQLDNGGVLQSNANTNPKIKPIISALPGSALSNCGRHLMSALKSSPRINDSPGKVLQPNPEIGPDYDFPQGNHSSHKGIINGSKTNTKSGIEPVPPGKPSLVSGRFIGSKAPEAKPVHDSPLGKHSLENERALRSRTNSNPETKHVNHTPPSNSVMIESNPKIESFNNTPHRRGRKKASGTTPNNEYSAIIDRVRYLLGQIKHRQNLINAYSGQGRKGQSTDNVYKKDIHRAQSDILKFKLEIRALFQHLDSALSEGQIDRTLFDSEGQIDSEDIYCAKCNSKDVSTDNDIILCDGMCVRAFHQKCLNPPLLTENIPVGDDGWLCPACECKIDCIKLLIEFQGSTMELTDTWEKVFPEAALIINGDKDDVVLPSVDAEDDNFDLCKDLDKESYKNDTISDESDFPSGTDLCNELREPSGAIEKTATSVAKFETVTKFGEEVLAEPDWGLKHESEKLMEKRKIERLDYKKIHDETYGDSSSDSSLDSSSDSTDNGNRSETYDTSDVDWRTPVGKQRSNKRKRHVRARVGRQKSNERKIHVRKYKNYPKSNGNTHNRDHQKLRSSANSSVSPYRKIEKATQQRLYEILQENQYPTNEEKEIIAQEFGITYEQVCRWFNATRHRMRHGLYIRSSNTITDTPKAVKHPKRKTILPKTPLKEGTMIKEIDMGASPSSFPVPNTINTYVSAGTTSISQIDMAASPNNFPAPNVINSCASAASVKEIDMGASPSSFPVPNTINAYVSAGTNQMDVAASLNSFPARTASVKEIDMSVSPSIFPMANADARTDSVKEIDMSVSPSSIPMAIAINSCVSTGTGSVDEQANKRENREKAVLEIPLKEGTSLSQIDIKRQQAIARELKKMKQGR